MSIEKKNDEQETQNRIIVSENLPEILAATAKALRQENMSESLIHLSLAAICGVRTTPVSLTNVRTF
ncbi:MAG: hypothetical protein PHN64_09855 [Desulfovibrionaceae bacterium]|nr:hypothetical protein [Desulfovibrionaceae bacterium]